MLHAPLHAALGWILIRDLDFAHVLFDTETAGDGLELLDDRLKESGSNSKKEMTKAWNEILEHAQAGHLQLFGEPFEKAPHIHTSGIGVFGLEKRFVRPNLPPSPIRREKLSNLVLVIPPKPEKEIGLQLRPRTWLSDGGWWWQEVFTTWETLIQLFPDIPVEQLSEESSAAPQPLAYPSETASFECDGLRQATTAESLSAPTENSAQHPETGDGKRSRKQPVLHEMIIWAYQKLFTDIPVPPDKTRNQMIRDLIHETYTTLPREKPSDTTIDRALNMKADDDV